MTKIYKKSNRVAKKKRMRVMSLILFIFGLIMLTYFAFPLISFQLYLQPVFASANLTSPIPMRSIISDASFGELVKVSTDGLIGKNYTDARNWYPSIAQGSVKPTLASYKITIPRLKITDAVVSTVDNDLSQHLVQYGGTTVPPEKGTAVIYGHSTLPQLYKEGDYKTIFAHIHQLTTGDDIIVTVNNKTYTYKVYSISITDPSDTSFFQQNFDGNYLTLVSCTPPGTTWKRLVIKTKLQ